MTAYRDGGAGPTRDLPAAGREGRAPRCPYKLQAAGKAWWRWAWSLPQATQWDAGSHYQLARRAQLEDSLAALDHFDPHSLDWFFSSLDLAPGDEERLYEALRQLGAVIAQLKSLAGSRLPILREMREIDDRFGLDARAMTNLRWTIAGEKKGDGLDDLAAARNARIAARARGGHAATQPPMDA